ncbi:MAG: AMP-binding protein, partial [Casimicrobiaceae bacterium]
MPLLSQRSIEREQFGEVSCRRYRVACGIIRPQAYIGLRSRGATIGPNGMRRLAMNANLYTLIESHFAGAAEEPCLLVPGGPVVHFDDLATLSAQIANALTGAGCKPGDRVAVQVDKHWQVVALYLACLRAGLVYLPLNNGYQKSELAYFFADA